MIINHQRNRFKGGNSKEILKKLIADNNDILNYIDLELDHIIPYCISTDNSLKNLQLLKKDIHKKKTCVDLEILKELRNLGYYEKITHYSLELLKPQEEVIIKFLELRNR